MLAATKADIGDFFTAGIGIIAQRNRIVSVPQKDATGGTILLADEIFASAKAGQSDIAALMDADIDIVRVQLDTGDSDTIKLVWSFFRCIRPFDPGHGRMLQLIVGDTGGTTARPVVIGDAAVHNQVAEADNLGIAHHDLAVQLRGAQGGDGLLHALEGGGHQGGKTHQMHILFPDGVHDRFHRHITAQVDDLKAIILQDDPDDVLADVVDIALDGGNDDAPLAGAALALLGNGGLDLLKSSQAVRLLFSMTVI